MEFNTLLICVVIVLRHHDDRPIPLLGLCRSTRCLPRLPGNFREAKQPDGVKVHQQPSCTTMPRILFCISAAEKITQAVAPLLHSWLQKKQLSTLTKQTCCFKAPVGKKYGTKTAKLTTHGYSQSYWRNGGKVSRHCGHSYLHPKNGSAWQF